MAQVGVVSFGTELKDGYKPVDAWVYCPVLPEKHLSETTTLQVANGIAWLEDVQQFYRERAAIEKEYSAKLTALAKKFHDRKAKKSSGLSVGDTPSLTPGSLESASLTTWTTQLTTLEARASEHDRLGQDLASQVAAPLEYVQKKYEEIRKSHAEHQTKLLREREGTYGELKKVKSRYDTVCQEVESRRKKNEAAMDHGKIKAANAYNQQLVEMHNVKNTYLININVTNKLKERYYHQYVPELLDSLQDLSETRVARLNQIWLLASSLEAGTLQRGVEQMKHLSTEIPRNHPTLDSMMFVRHNVVQWVEPSDMIFEPSPVWLDSDEMAVDEASKVFLRNILVKSKPLVRELKSDVEKRRREVENVKKIRQDIRAGRDKRDEVELVRAIFVIQEEMHAAEHKRVTAEVETSTITSVVGDLSVGAQNHNFKSETYKIPTNCDLCGDRIWGLNAKGFSCRDCGFTCHSKCELKVPAECPGEQTKEEKKRLKVERLQAAGAVAAVAPNLSTNGTSDVSGLSRQDTMNSLSSGYAASAHRSVSGTTSRSEIAAENSAPPRGSTVTSNSASTTSAIAPASNAVRRNRVVAPPPAAYVSPPVPAQSSNGAGQPKGKMLYAYEARDDGELSVEEGSEVVIIEPDDGGWTKVHAGTGPEGLVPSAYLEELPQTTFTITTPPIERPISGYSDSTASMASTTTAARRKGPAVAPKRGAKKLKYAEAMYAYQAQSDAEFDMAEGERFVLISMGSGDGWAEVEKGGDTKSVPANYIQEV